MILDETKEEHEDGFGKEEFKPGWVAKEITETDETSNKGKQNACVH